jgi:23S rRNA (cytidine1920-2'-O)/16S rRNA (cytidine1409-2'-O)-methyltransferase
LSVKNRLDIELVKRGIVSTRSQAESYIKLGKVLVNKKPILKPGFFVDSSATLILTQDEQYVSRAGLKLASVAKIFNLDFNDKVVLDVGSSTGGFTDFALKNNAKKVIAVDVGTNQLHPSLRNNPQIELYEQTDIRDFANRPPVSGAILALDIVVADVSFISLRDILPSISQLCSKSTQIVVMVKPQFESGDDFRHKGVIKNDSIRRDILKNFEIWIKKQFVVIAKADSAIAGSKGNRERFYLLKMLNNK